MIVEFKSSNTTIVFCCVDNTHVYRSAWTEELIKNQADSVIANLVNKGYTILQGQDEDLLLKTAQEKEFELAVVFSTGTEFINGTAFIDAVEDTRDKDFFIAGHVLDRGDAYYELHHQCYIVNLKYYKKLNYPFIGKQILGHAHHQTKPNRSLENIHDDYTPIWISQGKDLVQFNHCCHGWNFVRTSLDNNLPIIVFDKKFRDNKKYFYPENQEEFLKHLSWAYKRLHYCSDEYIHYANTEKANQNLSNIEQIVTPASGLWWEKMIDKEKNVIVVMYDYNQKSIDYWKEHVPQYPNVEYYFQRVNILTDMLDLSILDKYKPTLINLSNIFAYEGTTFFYSLEYRLSKENQTIDMIAEHFPNATINFTARSADGFSFEHKFFPANEKIKTDLMRCKKPTWHWRDWL